MQHHFVIIVKAKIRIFALPQKTKTKKQTVASHAKSSRFLLIYLLFVCQFQNIISGDVVFIEFKGTNYIWIYFLLYKYSKTLFLSS